MKIYKADWSKYNFDRALSYLMRCGLNGKAPSLDSYWMKIIVNMQIYGGCGTADDILSYSGIDPKNISYYHKHKFFYFLNYYYIVEPIKRLWKGGRVFELTKFGEDLIQYGATH